MSALCIPSSYTLYLCIPSSLFPLVSPPLDLRPLGRFEYQLEDQRITDNCIQNLNLASNMSAPFFVGCGFHKVKACRCRCISSHLPCTMCRMCRGKAPLRPMADVLRWELCRGPAVSMIISLILINITFPHPRYPTAARPLGRPSQLLRRPPELAGHPRRQGHIRSHRHANGCMAPAVGCKRLRRRRV
jgi:hypothetical protein